MIRPVAISAVLFVCGCPSTNKSDAPPPSATIALAPSSGWVVTRRGAAPTVQQGSVHVSVSGTARGEDQRYLAGIAFGQDKGPQLGFLSGFFAPLILPTETGKNYDTRIEGGDPDLRVRFDGLLVRTTTAGSHVRSGIVGEALVALPADRTEIRASLKGEPTVRFKVSAGDEPSTTWFDADRFEIVTEKMGTVAIVSSCASIGVIRPTPKGTTSVFLVHVGGQAPVSDALFTSEEHAVKPKTACDETQSSTVSLPWPPPPR